MMACFSDPPSLQFLIECYSNSYDPIYFEKSDLDSFYFLQTDTNNLMPLDSIKVQFGYSSFDGKNYYSCYLEGSNFKNQIDLRKYDFLLINRTINFIDTVSEIKYWEKDTTILCNTCSIPPDEYANIKIVKDFKYNYNGNEILVDYYHAQILKQ